MRERIDKRQRADLFRARVAKAMAEQGMSQSALARAVGVDRSTVSQLLNDEGARLPNAQIAAECAAALGVSADWLLGLSDRPERLAELMAASLTMTEAPRALVDEQIFAWHQEAAGYKIRHVPAALPDMLKTREMLRWEYTPHLGRTADQAIGASEDRLGWMRAARSDYEIALPQHELTSFTRATGYYDGLPTAIRRDQLDRMIRLTEQLYPAMRLHLFDARRTFSAPITVFGPLLAVLYLGRHYLAFRDSDRVATFSRHFDWLVREATVEARDLPAYLRQLRSEIPED
ncbi:helix-turn-helix domain-containing protein [Acidimangrovimonas pyrenivorans]|uniref:Helix-turn-helix domain-containing protein n=1 Tax=Acidimangrovimonas pyrenivorans TaxID=2030798 RepID=A0ABV7AL75_9RHOB